MEQIFEGFDDAGWTGGWKVSLRVWRGGGQGTREEDGRF